MTTPINKPATWFWIVSIVALLWNLGGLMAFIMQVTMTEEMLQAMPEEERALYAAIPMWITAMFCIAVVGSIIGNILLLMRKKIATPVLVISFVAIVIQMSYTLFMSKAVEVHGWAQASILPIFIVIIGGMMVLLSRSANAKGWLS